MSLDQDSSNREIAGTVKTSNRPITRSSYCRLRLEWGNLLCDWFPSASCTVVAADRCLDKGRIHTACERAFRARVAGVRAPGHIIAADVECTLCCIVLWMRGSTEILLTSRAETISHTAILDAISVRTWHGWPRINDHSVVGSEIACCLDQRGVLEAGDQETEAFHEMASSSACCG